MKKISIYLMSLVFISAVFLSSCDKEMEVEKTAINSEISAEDIAIASQVKEFKNIMNSSNKTGTMYTVSEMEWLIETTINYYYSQSLNAEEISGDSIVIPFNSNNGLINSDEVSLIFNSVLLSLGEQSRNINGSDVNLSYTNVSIYEEDGIFNLLAIGSFNYISSNKGAVIPTEISTIGDDDFWWSTNNAGKCGDFEDTFEGRDAGDIICEEVAPKVRNYSGINKYWADVRKEIFVYSDYPKEEGSKYTYDYRIFYFSSLWTWFAAPGWPCLNPDEIQYFATELEKIIIDYFENKTETCIKLNYVAGWAQMQPTTVKKHIPNVDCGILRTRYLGEADGDLYSLP